MGGGYDMIYDMGIKGIRYTCDAITLKEDRIRVMNNGASRNKCEISQTFSL